MNTRSCLILLLISTVFLFTNTSLAVAATTPTECENIPATLSLSSAASGAVNATLGNNPASANESVLCAPVPRIKIPGLSFTSTTDYESLVERDSQGDIIAYHIPFLSQYLAAIYRYTIALAGVVCIFLLIFSGVQWTLYGASPDSVESAKERIKNAITGLILITSSYTILYTINPNLVEFKSLKVTIVKKIDYGALTSQMIQRDGSGNIVFTPISDGQHRSSPGPNQPLTEEEVINLSQATGINTCLVVATYKTESPRIHAIGKDENVRRCNIKSRRYFLASGVKYSGERFTPPQGADPTAYNGTECGVDILNDSIFDLNSPPDYGLDWRFSQGIGAGQYTIFPEYTYPEPDRRRMGQRIDGPNGPEYARYSSQSQRWYTVTDLLNADLAFEATLGLMVHCYNRQDGNPTGFRNCYGGGNDPTDPSQWDINDPPNPRFMGHYCTCIRERGASLGIPSDPQCTYYP